MGEYFDLGKHTRTITTDSAEAQTWFDRGLNWTYAFHREEAIRCFERVVELDPQAAMGYWGIAFIRGPYYNAPWRLVPPPMRPSLLRKANAAVRSAEELAPKATEVEQALIGALVARFPEPENEHDDMDVFDGWDDAYADAMRGVYARFPDDEDVACLTVEALSCRTPWEMWDLDERAPAEGADTIEALEIIDRTLAAGEQAGTRPHAGLLHYKIHILEMSPTPEDALPASDALGELMPDAAHLIHMPSHIYILCGKYEEARQVNADAVVADDKYVDQYPEIGLYTIYRMHNIHFQIYAAMFLGQQERAMAAADQIWETVTAEALGQVENEFFANYLEVFYGMKVHAMIRFGLWQDIIDAPMPEDQELFVVTTALWHYAKGVAKSATGDIAGAEEQQRLFAEAWERVPESRQVFHNECRDVLKVGEAMLAGELEYRRGNHDTAFDHLRRCVDLYDQLNYSEPWTWMQPPRHALGALLLEQDQVEEAASVYRADLGLDDVLVRPSQHPGNIWSLHGYLECCERLGRDDEAADVRSELVAAQVASDIDLTSSCFCRLPESCCD